MHPSRRSGRKSRLSRRRGPLLSDLHPAIALRKSRARAGHHREKDTQVPPKESPGDRKTLEQAGNKHSRWMNSWLITCSDGEDGSARRICGDRGDDFAGGVGQDGELDSEAVKAIQRRVYKKLAFVEGGVMQRCPDGRDLDFRWPGSDGRSVPDERNGQALSQSGAARGTHRVRLGRDGVVQGHGTLVCPLVQIAAICPGINVVRRGAAAGLYTKQASQ